MIYSKHDNSNWFVRSLRDKNAELKYHVLSIEKRNGRPQCFLYSQLVENRDWCLDLIEIVQKATTSEIDALIPIIDKFINVRKSYGERI